MATATGFMKEVYNGKQLAYKISMNSVYGFTGAGKGILPCVPIASTTTFKGRMMIEETKNYVEKNFPGAKVRYGDTDSVMVEFDVGDRKGVEAVEYSWEVGERAAEECSALFKKPNNLELEKVYWPYFLYSKKRYAAKLWTKGKMVRCIWTILTSRVSKLSAATTHPMSRGVQGTVGCSLHIKRPWSTNGVGSRKSYRTSIW
jgi:DNA polymerase delta subunit 1